MTNLISYDRFEALVRQVAPLARLRGFSNTDMVGFYAALMAAALAGSCKDVEEINKLGDKLMTRVISEAMALKDGMVGADGDHR